MIGAWRRGGVLVGNRCVGVDGVGQRWVKCGGALTHLPIAETAKTKKGTFSGSFRPL